MRRRLRTLGPLVLAAIVPAVVGAPVRAQTPADDVEVILAIDTSASMQVAIDAAKRAANEFVAAMPAGVRIGVETFADDVELLTLPTLDRARVTAAIDAIEADGDTALYDVVVATGQHFTPTVDNKVLVLLSDGKDEGSDATLDEAVAAAAGFRVEAISLTTPLTDVASLSSLGPVTSASDLAGMSEAFARVAGLIVEVVAPSTTTVPPTTTTIPPTTTPPPTTSKPAPAVPTTTATTTTATTTTATTETIVAAPVAPAPSAGVSRPVERPVSSRLLWLGAFGVFAGLLVLGLLLFPKDRVSKARLGIDKPRTVSEMGVRTTTAIEEALERYGKRADLGTALSVADISMKPAEFVAMVVLVAVVAGAVALLLGGLLLAVVVTIAVCLGVRVYVLRTKAQRQAAFADQLPDVLQLVTTALRSGYGITQAMESVAEEGQEPARTEFARVLAEVRLGRDLPGSLRALADRMESPDLGWVVSAIEINLETGGNLSEILQQVGVTIRERGRIARQVRTLTAEGRLSARILTGLPAVMLLWQWRVNPDNFDLLTNGVGLIALAIAGILLVLGSVWVHKIANSVAL